MISDTLAVWLLVSQVTSYGLVPTNEARPPQQFVSSITLRCDSATLIVTGYGLVHPGRRRPTVSLNGREVTGAAAGRLRTDLSIPGTVYRLTGGCFQPGPAIQLYVYAGENVAGAIRYRSARAEFYRGRLDYTGLEDANAETFWFR